MAFYKKKIEKLAAESAAAFLKELQEIEQGVAKTMAITDPAERYIACADAAKRLSELQEKAWKSTWKGSSTATSLLAHTAGWGTGAVFTGAAVAAAVLFAAPVLIAFAGVGVFGVLSGQVVSDRLQARNQAILAGSVETLEESISALRTAIAEERKNILKASLPEIAESEHFASMHSRFEDVKEAFAIAVARETIAEQRNKISGLKKPPVKK